jgi:YD repeat-containing protein
MRYLKLLCLTVLVLLPLHASSETLTFSYDPAGKLIGAFLNYGVNVTYVYDATGNRLDRTVTIDIPEAGDINNDGAIKLDDAVLTLQLLSGVITETPIFKTCDINGNNMIDLAETIWILRILAEL